MCSYHAKSRPLPLSYRIPTARRAVPIPGGRNLIGTGVSSRGGDHVAKRVVLPVAAIGLAAASERGADGVHGRLPAGVLDGRAGRPGGQLRAHRGVQVGEAERGWHRSGCAHVTTAPGAPGTATRRSSRSAATGSAAYCTCTALNAVTVSNESSGYGSTSSSPSRRSVVGTRSAPPQ